MDPQLLLAILIAWNPGGIQGARGATTDDELAVWSDAIAQQCTSRRECLELEDIASLESRFAPWILDHSCNNNEWRLRHRKDKVCDHGLAHGPFQFQQRAWLKYSSIPIDEADAREHVRVARHLLADNPNAWTVYIQAHADVAAWMKAHP